MIAKLFQRRPAAPPMDILTEAGTDGCSMLLPTARKLAPVPAVGTRPKDPPVAIPHAGPVSKIVFTPPVGKHEPLKGDPVCDACSAVYQRGWCDSKAPGSKCPRD